MAKTKAEVMEVNRQTIQEAMIKAGNHAEVIGKAHAIVVKDQASYDEAGEFGKGLKARIKKIEDVFDPICDAAFATHKAATTARKNAFGPLQEVIQIVAGKMISWTKERERKRLDAERRERERLEAIEREKLAVEAERLRAIAEKEAEAARKVAEAEAKEAASKAAAARIKKAAEEEAARIKAEAEEAAQAKLDEPVFTEPVSERHAVKRFKTEKVAGITHKKNWQFEEVDVSKAPREYMMLDAKKVGKLVKAVGKDAEKILQGAIRVFDKGSTSFKVEK